MPTTRAQSGWLIESNGQPHGNFEVALSGDRCAEHWWRDNGNRNLPWKTSGKIAESTGMSHADRHDHLWYSPNVVLSTWGNLEFVGIEDAGAVQRAVHYWRNPFGWQGPHEAYATSTGTPPASVAHIQSLAGDPPMFQLLMTRRDFDHGLAHLVRREDPDSWHEVDHVASGVEVDGVAMIESNFGDLEALFTSQGNLLFAWRAEHGWSPPHPVGGGSGRPALVQSSFGRRGNFEAVVAGPPGTDGLLFYWRDNDAAQTPLRPAGAWSHPMVIPGSQGRGGYDDVAMIQSSFDGHLEVLARRRVPGYQINQRPVIDVYWRDRDPTWAWHGPYPMA